jgi:hypothetical protein
MKIFETPNFVSPTLDQLDTNMQNHRLIVEDAHHINFNFPSVYSFV